MRRLFRKYWYVILIVVIILILAVVVQYTKGTNDVARWVFNFLKDWAVILGALGTFLLAGIALWTIMRNRRSKMANELYTWARSSMKLMTPAYDETLTTTQRLDTLKSRLSTIESEAISLLVDAAKFSESICKKVQTIISNCSEVRQLDLTMENEDEVVKKTYELLEIITIDLTSIIFETT